MTALSIRPMGDADIATAAALYGRCFGEDWAVQSLRDLMRTPGCWGLIAYAPDPVGFLLARIVVGEGEILSIGVDPDRRREAFGKTLMEAAIVLSQQSADAMFLEVGTDNPAADALYRGLGFRQVGLRKDYYRRPGGRRADARILRLDLTKDL